MDDMAHELDDMSQQMDDVSSLVDDMNMSGQQQVEYLVEESFLGSLACEGPADQVTVTTLGLCFSECMGCGSFKNELASRTITAAGHVEVVRLRYSDDSCRVGRSQHSSFGQQHLGCESASSSARNVSIAVTFPALDSASYFVSR